MFTRWRRGVSPGQGGRDHLHFRLLDMGVNERTLVVGYWIFCAALGAFTLLIDDRVLKLAALGAGVVLGIAIFVWASRQSVKSMS
jgi:UDP-GlcNAc:undecaprenyl-phosphate GlcNAc-1-phosphate transferase